MENFEYDVFISYSRKDTDVAERIVRAFAAKGITYFIDRQGIGGGMEFPALLAKAIRSSRVFLFLASKNSYESKFTQNEIVYAFNKKDKNNIIPYIIDGSTLPEELEFTFAAINWRNLKEHPIETVLIDDILQKIGRKSIASPMEEQRSPTTPLQQPTQQTVHKDAGSKSWFPSSLSFTSKHLAWSIFVGAVILFVLVLCLTTSFVQENENVLSALSFIAVFTTFVFVLVGYIRPASVCLSNRKEVSKFYLPAFILTFFAIGVIGTRCRNYNEIDDHDDVDSIAAQIPLEGEEADQPIIDENAPIVSFVVNGVSFKMIRVEGGTFTMGATPEQGDDVYGNEKPAHEVTLSSFFLGETEVTQALWKAVMHHNPSAFKGDNLPVEQVSWNDCKAFINKLNITLGVTFRLPTEAEWEYAARGGNKSLGNKFSGSNNLNDVAWFEDNSHNVSHPVKSMDPNELGIYDMSGNVWEWCLDEMHNYSANVQTNPLYSSEGSLRVFRGGSWRNSSGRCRVSYRFNSTPDDCINSVGFRLAMQL